MTPRSSPPTEYQKRRRAFRQESLHTWRELTAQLVGSADMAAWHRLDQIIEILDLIAKRCPLNHMLYPDGGGNDLEGATRSVEDGCAELDLGGAVIVRPTELQLVRPQNDPIADWTYFRLETATLAPSGLYRNVDSYEELLELTPGRYVERYWLDEGFYGHDEEGREIPLPKGARCVIRQLGGAFLVVAKASTYNSISGSFDAYDGDHARMDAAQFRQMIERSIAIAHRR